MSVSPTTDEVLRAPPGLKVFLDRLELFIETPKPSAHVGRMQQRASWVCIKE